MTSINENANKISKFLIEKGCISSSSAITRIEAAELCEISYAEFSKAEDYLIAKGMVTGTMGGQDGIVYLTGKGIDFTESLNNTSEASKPLKNIKLEHNVEQKEIIDQTLKKEEKQNEQENTKKNWWVPTIIIGVLGLIGYIFTGYLPKQLEIKSTSTAEARLSQVAGSQIVPTKNPTSTPIIDPTFTNIPRPELIITPTLTEYPYNLSILIGIIIPCNDKYTEYDYNQRLKSINLSVQKIELCTIDTKDVFNTLDLYDVIIIPTGWDASRYELEKYSNSFKTFVDLGKGILIEEGNVEQSYVTTFLPKNLTFVDQNVYPSDTVALKENRDHFIFTGYIKDSLQILPRDKVKENEFYKVLSRGKESKYPSIMYYQNDKGGKVLVSLGNICNLPSNDDNNQLLKNMFYWLKDKTLK